MPLPNAVSLLWRYGVIASLLLVMQCSTVPPFAPEGTTIVLAADPVAIAASGDTAAVTAFLAESDDVLVENGTRVTFIVSGGGVCGVKQRDQETCAEGGSAWPTSFTASTTDGTATVLVRSPARAGDVTVTARSGSVTKEIAIKVSSLVAPVDAKAVISIDADTVTIGDAVAVRAFLQAADNSTVPDQTRAVFMSEGNAITKAIVLTREGFAETMLVAQRAGQGIVTVASGQLTVADTFVVRQP